MALNAGTLALRSVPVEAHQALEIEFLENPIIRSVVCIRLRSGAIDLPNSQSCWVE